MSKNHPLEALVENRRKGIHTGMYSVCSANAYVLAAAMEKAEEEGGHVLIEATANQVNQFGGYTGMKPADFVRFVYGIAKEIGFQKDRIILGGDHLGPLVWKKQSETEAMAKAEDLIRDYIEAGFTKIHLDTSMRLGDDPRDRILRDEVIAARGARLCKIAESAFQKRNMMDSQAMAPVYVIGSEVPIPGGSQEEEGLTVTAPEAFEHTVEVFGRQFEKAGLQSAWDRVIAVVVQPGVEFGDETIHEYNREKARPLTEVLLKYPGLVFEGHSTDYQTPFHLRQMVEDGIALLKVGPALTFALREALFALNAMEEEMLRGQNDMAPSCFKEVLDREMLKHPDNWKAYYHGDDVRQAFSRKYSFSDRCRYYLPNREVKASIERLYGNLQDTGIPLSLLSQFMPIQYTRVREGSLQNNPESLIKDRIKNMMEDYYAAVKP